MQEQTKTLSAQDWIIRDKTKRSGRNKTTTKCGGSRPEGPRLDPSGQNQHQGPPPPGWSIRGQVAARRPGQVHTGRNKEQGLPPPGPDHPGTSGGQTPRTGSSGAGQAAGAAAPRTGSTGEKGRPGAPDWNIRGGSGSRT